MKRLAALGAVALAFGWLPMVPAHAGDTPSAFAADAEAWSYSVEAGIPGPLGPLASHTTAGVDNSPHATGASGLADPGYLVRAAAGLVAGVPTPAYCESAWPEGPGHADCGASATAAHSGTDSGGGPKATATAALGRVTPADAAGALTIDLQSTTSSAFMESGGTLRATADVTLQGVAIAGGAVRLSALVVHREASAGGTTAPTSSSSVELSGVTVGGDPVDPGADQLTALADAVQNAFGDVLVVEALRGRVGRPQPGQLSADSSGLRILWRPQPDRWIQIVLGYGRVSVYRTGGAAGAVGVGLPAGAASPPVDEGTVASSRDGAVSSELGTDPSAALPSADVAAPVVSVQPVPGLLAASVTTPVRWVSPFLVLAQMASGKQFGWFLLVLAPLFVGVWLTRRSGMGLLAPWLGRSR